MATASIESIRRAAAVGAAGALGTVLSGAITQAVVQPATTVSDDRWSYPWSSAALVPVSLVYACLHVLVFVGVLGFARSGLAGTSRSARVGVVLALAGTALFMVAELASLPFRNELTDDTGPSLVGACFGLATLLSAAGFLAAGAATLRAGLWSDWRRFTPLAVGTWMAAMLGLALTNALPAGVAILGLCLLALAVALFTQPSPSPAATDVTRLDAQEQAT